jgi:hypothetical protein
MLMVIYLIHLHKQQQYLAGNTVNGTSIGFDYSSTSSHVYYPAGIDL